MASKGFVRRGLRRLEAREALGAVLGETGCRFLPGWPQDLVQDGLLERAGAWSSDRPSDFRLTPRGAQALADMTGQPVEWRDLAGASRTTQPQCGAQLSRVEKGGRVWFSPVNKSELLAQCERACAAARSAQSSATGDCDEAFRRIAMDEYEEAERYLDHARRRARLRGDRKLSSAIFQAWKAVRSVEHPEIYSRPRRGRYSTLH